MLEIFFRGALKGAGACAIAAYQRFIEEQVGVDTSSPLSERNPNDHRVLTYARAWVAHQATSLRIASLAHVARTFGRNEASLRESLRLHFPADE